MELNWKKRCLLHGRDILYKLIIIIIIIITIVIINCLYFIFFKQLKETFEF